MDSTELYDFQLQEQIAAQQAQQDLQELIDALNDQKNEYEILLSNYMQIHRQDRPQLSGHIIHELKSLTKLVGVVECLICLNTEFGMNFDFLLPTKTLIDAHDENKWIFNWIHQEQQIRSNIQPIAAHTVRPHQLYKNKRFNK